MTKRPRIAEDFFDETFAKPETTKPPPAAVKAQEAKPTPTTRKQPPKAPSTEPDSKVRTTLYIREELHEKARWAILNLEKAPRSISQLIEHALERELSRLSKASGKEIERHRMALPGGRPRVTA